MLIIATLLAGLATALACTAAHRRMAKRTYITPIPRYGVGVACALIPWTLASIPALLAPNLQAVLTLGIGIWYVFGCGGFATWLAYEDDRPRATEADARRLAAFIAGEHDDAPRRGD